MTSAPDTTAADATPTADLPSADTRAGLLARVRPATLLAFRLVVAVLFVLHPVSMLGLLDGSNPPLFMAVVSLVEIVLVALVAAGLFARPAAFLLSGMLAYAFFAVHLPGGWNWMENGGEPAALYSWIFLLLCVLGPGPLSLGGRRAQPAVELSR